MIIKKINRYLLISLTHANFKINKQKKAESEIFRTQFLGFYPLRETLCYYSPYQYLFNIASSTLVQAYLCTMEKFTGNVCKSIFLKRESNSKCTDESIVQTTFNIDSFAYSVEQRENLSCVCIQILYWPYLNWKEAVKRLHIKLAVLLI